MIAKIENEKTDLIMAVAERMREIGELKQKIESLQQDEQALRSEISTLKETLARTAEIVQAPVKMTSREDVAQTIKDGLIAKARLEQALKQIEDLKARHTGCVPKEVQMERDMAEADLEDAQLKLEEKDSMLDSLGSNILGARVISTRIFNAGQPTATVYNVFVHEYSQLMLLKAPPEMWKTTRATADWVSFWRSITPKQQGILALAWMLGWEEVERQ
jgi:multidrug efflux pump subunit AcrA (membrane-fusion protein)